MTLALVDEWVIPSDDAEWMQFAKAAAVIRFAELCGSRRLQPVPFLKEIPHGELRAVRTDVRARAYAAYRLLCCADYTGTPPAVLEKGPGDLTAQWLGCLAATITLGDGWRDPVVAVPRDRWQDEIWPKAQGEIAATVPGRGTHARSLVCAGVEDFELHPRARNDADPWLLLSRPPTDEAPWPNPAPRILPCPPELRTVPVHRLVQAIREYNEEWKRSIGAKEFCFYLPPTEGEGAWDPVIWPKERWRDGTPFPRSQKRTRIGLLHGFLDRDGRIWVWDANEGGHWDVQDADERNLTGRDKVAFNGEHLGRTD